MIQILWAVLNIGLMIAFIFVFIRATKLIKQQLGWWAAAVLVFGWAASCSRQDTRHSEIQNIEKRGFVSQDSVGTIRQVRVDLEDNLAFSNTLMIYCGEDLVSKQTRPINASCSLLGIIIGVAWEPRMISVQKVSSDATLSYTVDGKMNWTLLGMLVYTQHKMYRGSTSLK